MQSECQRDAQCLAVGELSVLGAMSLGSVSKWREDRSRGFRWLGGSVLRFGMRFGIAVGAQIRA